MTWPWVAFTATIVFGLCFLVWISARTASEAKG
jgi:hypothetical protein